MGGRHRQDGDADQKDPHEVISALAAASLDRPMVEAIERVCKASLIAVGMAGAGR
jgi:hypothetical protein